MDFRDCINECSFLKLFSFISSMFPLSVYLIISNWNNNYKLLKIKYLTAKNIFIFIFIIEILSIVYVKFFYSHLLKKASKNQGKTVTIKNPIQEKVNTSNYLLANVLPIITLDFNNNSMVIFTILLLFTLCFMYIKNDLYYINPFYDLFNIKIYNCDVIFKGGTKTNPILKKTTVISKINLYDFKNKEFLIIEKSDIIFIVNELDN